MDDASINFYVCVAGMAFAFGGGAVVVEVLKVVLNRPQEFRYLRSILLLCVSVVGACLFPLMLAETSLNLSVSSLWLGTTTAALMIYLLYEIATNKVTVQFPKTTFILFVLSGICECVIASNALFLRSFVLYKLATLWALFILGYRFYLFVRHLAQLQSVSN